MVAMETGHFLKTLNDASLASQKPNVGTLVQGYPPPLPDYKV